jgi:hypothetical protein
MRWTFLLLLLFGLVMSIFGAAPSDDMNAVAEKYAHLVLF